jgi:Na+/melibiose symporter-like transporter
MKRSIPKLASLQQLRHDWRHTFLEVIDTLLPVLALGPLLMLAIMNFAGSFIPVNDSVAPLTFWLVWVLGLNPLLQVILAFVLTALICLPLLLSAVGRYPTQADVELNQRLRRALDMSDEISTD